MLGSTSRRMPLHDTCRAGRGPTCADCSWASVFARSFCSCASLLFAARMFVRARSICWPLMICRHTNTT